MCRYGLKYSSHNSFSVCCSDSRSSFFFLLLRHHLPLHFEIRLKQSTMFTENSRQFVEQCFRSVELAKWLIKGPSMFSRKPASQLPLSLQPPQGQGSGLTDIRGHNEAEKQRNNLNGSAGSRNRTRKSTRIDTPTFCKQLRPKADSVILTLACSMLQTPYLQADGMRSLWPRLISHQISLLSCKKKEIKHAFAYIYALRGGPSIKREIPAFALNKFELEQTIVPDDVCHYWRSMGSFVAA